MEQVLTLMRTMRHRFRVSDPQALEAILRCVLVVAEERGMDESDKELLLVMIAAHRAHCG